jgi:Mn-dependent DtxR family transcriptional regulator
VKHAVEEVTHSAAHYLMAIHQLRQEYGYARITDVAGRLRVTRGAASMAMSQLKRRELTAEDPHRFLLLTEKGHRMVHDLERNYDVLRRFLETVLGLPGDVAHADACKMEHLLSMETGRRLLWLMERVMKKPKLMSEIGSIMTKFEMDPEPAADLES